MPYTSPAQDWCLTGYPYQSPTVCWPKFWANHVVSFTFESRKSLCTATSWRNWKCFRGSTSSSARSARRRAPPRTPPRRPAPAARLHARRLAAARPRGPPPGGSRRARRRRTTAAARRAPRAAFARPPAPSRRGGAASRSGPPGGSAAPAPLHISWRHPCHAPLLGALDEAARSHEGRRARQQERWNHSHWQWKGHVCSAGVKASEFQYTRCVAWRQ